jgi:ribosomal protein S18 acetylase RimI-like enzyme
LMDACLKAAARMGFQTMWLGVWEKNLRAIRFYQKWGFSKAGDKQFVLGQDVQNDFVLVRPI